MYIMGKIARTFTIDEDVYKKAKLRYDNLSGEVNAALRKRLSAVKTDMPEEIIWLKCSKCGDLVEYGFFCDLMQKFFCKDCNLEKIEREDGKLSERFSCLNTEEHEHIRVPALPPSPQAHKGYDSTIRDHLHKQLGVTYGNDVKTSPKALNVQ